VEIIEECECLLASTHTLQLQSSTHTVRKPGQIAAICRFIMSRLQKVNLFVRGQANERCDSCNYLKLLAVRLSPQAVICEFRVFAGDFIIYQATLFCVVEIGQ
jgi:hypothetical protein